MTTASSFVSIDQLLARKAGQPVIFNRQGSINFVGPETAFATGFHVYTQIGLTLPIAAAEDDVSAARYLEILSDYAGIGEAAAQASGARLLEVQGERLHFLLEEPNLSSAPNTSSWQRLFTLTYAVMNMAYDRLAPKAKDHWDGCTAAADFGPAALLYSETGGGSLVSLGNPANTPAKRLGQEPGVMAGHLAIPDALALREFGGTSSRKWIEIDLRNPGEGARRYLGRDITGAVRQYLTNRAAPQIPRLSQLDRRLFDSLQAGSAINPTRVQGFSFRADLDGFTKQVQAAFAAGPEAVMDLVRRFHALLDFPAYFSSQLRGARTIILPWAGDCANILLLPEYGSSFALARSEMPANAALRWHKSFGAERKYVDAVGGARWTLGLAAGDETEGNDGRMIVADLAAAGRTFRVAGGWATLRSSDGYQYDGVVAGDTVLPKVDRGYLWEHYRDAFKDLSSMFARASITNLQKCSAERQSRAAFSATAASTISAPIPSPRPFGYA